jgi:hypothetical protein
MTSLLLALAFLLPHDFFISILTIRHASAEKQLHLTWRMTTHDVEHALEPLVQGRKLHLGTPLQHPQADSLLRAYVLGHLALEVNGSPHTVEMLGYEVEMEDMYCYLQVNEVAAIERLTVRSSLLFDLFDEQENVVHLEVPGGTLSHTFRNSDLPHTFIVAP